MLKTKKIWQSGRLVPWKKAQVHLLTHSLHYGSAIFEGIRFYETEKGPVVFRLRDHIRRFKFSAKTMGMKIDFSLAELEEATLKLVRANKLKSGYIRPLAYFDQGKMGLKPDPALTRVAIICWSWGAYLGDEPIKVGTSSFIRIHPKSSVMEAKIAGHYANSILASLEANKKAFDEALFLDHRGYVAEGPGENIFMVKKKTLYTPKEESILAGITRDTVMKLAADLGYEIMEKNISLDELKAADELFFTGTAAEITPIAQVDKKKIKKAFGPVTRELREAYMGVVKGKRKGYGRWITVV